MGIAPGQLTRSLLILSMSDAYIYPYVSLLLLATVLGLIWYRKLQAPFKVLALLILVTLASEAIRFLYPGFVFSSLVLHIYLNVSIILYGIIYYLLLKGKRKKFFILAGTICTLIFSLINSFTHYGQGLRSFPHYTMIIMSITCVCYAFLSNYEMIRVSTDKSIFKNGVFWFNNAILFFFSIAFVFWCLYNYLLRTQIPILMNLMTMLWVLNLILYSLFIISMYFNSRRKIDQVAHFEE